MNKILICLLLLNAVSFGQCNDWPTLCPTINDLIVHDADNLPILDPPASPGDIDELSVCPPSINDTKRRQLDITDTLVACQNDQFFLRSYYNSVSAASTTSQFWFIDLDLDPSTGGPDTVSPWYIDTGPIQNHGASACTSPQCSSITQLLPYATGFDYYIMSYGQNADQFAIFKWNYSTLVWEEAPKPPLPAVNLQGAEDNPINAYSGNNGYRGVSYIPKEYIGVETEIFRLFSRSWNCIECCGDTTGGEGTVYVPGTRPCSVELCGDCDLNGFVDILDAFYAAMVSIGFTELLTDVQMGNCNVVGEYDPSSFARISILDALEIANYVAGYSTLTCCIP